MSGECPGSFFHFIRGGPVDGGRDRPAGILEQNVLPEAVVPRLVQHRRRHAVHEGGLRRHSVLGGVDVEHCDVHTGGLLDDGDEVAERLVAQPVLGPEFLRGLPPVGLRIDTHATAGIA